jgi:hypothetical protein
MFFISHSELASSNGNKENTLIERSPKLKLTNTTHIYVDSNIMRVMLHNIFDNV